MKDLIVLAPDKNVEYAVRGLLGRPDALRVRPVSYDALVHPRRDPGVFLDAHDFLRPFSGEYGYALVLFDHEGCGHEDEAPGDLRNAVRSHLELNGWAGRAEVIVFVPELEVWVWSASPHVAACLGWEGQRPPLSDWLREQGYWPEGTPKPPRPKEALEAALRQAQKPRSSAIYQQLAERVSLRGHREPAFNLFTLTLTRWFGQ